MTDFSTTLVAVYRNVEASAPGRAFVALLQHGGSLGPHTAAFTFGASEAEVRQKAGDAIESWANPVKKHKHPAELAVVRDLEKRDALDPLRIIGSTDPRSFAISNTDALSD